MTLKSIYLVSIAFIAFQTVFCQTKNEKEERVNLSSFPETAQTIINTLPDKCKRLRFYRETDGDKLSYEAKFKYKKKRYSLEFSEIGQIEDIEVYTKLKRIENTIQNQISTYFSDSYIKYKLIKIQKQYVYPDDYIASQFVIDVLSQNSKVKANYEIIAEVKLGKVRSIKEFTFNNDGTFLKFRILKPTSYEHVLY